MQQFGRDRVESGHRADIADIIDWSKMTQTGNCGAAGQQLRGPSIGQILSQQEFMVEWRVVQK
jgi:hypothetical protein